MVLNNLLYIKVVSYNRISLEFVVSKYPSLVSISAYRRFLAFLLWTKTDWQNWDGNNQQRLHVI
jgi:hypothetical protein